ncbi:hypothetical protein HanIR_Chr01g0003051 [Helianthus annuus]|nr:hypothetical protein HanIR_Chr01g0003051 [Helianthus annuus]
MAHSHWLILKFTTFKLIHWSRQVGLIPSFRGSVAGSSADLSPAQGKHTVTRNKEDGVGGAPCYHSSA